jgi:hypothetical protein
MPRNRQHRNQLKHQHQKVSEGKEHRTRAARWSLVLAIGILLLVLAALIFKFLGSSWPAWLIENRSLFIGILAFLTIFLGLMSPLIAEVIRNPRALSGPGKNPEFQYPDTIKK